MVYYPDISTFLKSIDEENAEIILSLLKEEKIKKNTVLLSEGEICTKNYILKNGVARKYFIHSDKEITTEIYLEGDVAFSFESFTYQTKATENIVAVTDLECFVIDYKDYMNAKTRYTWFAEIDLMFIERYTIQLEHKIKELATLNAAERYERFLSIIPNFYNKCH
jgi:CRP-like cAMP-binding protein